MNLLVQLILFLGLLARGDDPSVLVIEIRGTINPATVGYLDGAISRAVEQKSKLILIELDTPGGLVASVRSMAQSIDASAVPVAVFVTPAGSAATSAGALLSFSSHVSAMSPGTNLGAAHPVTGEGKDIEGDMKEKAVNDTSAFARGLAELRGRNVLLSEKVVTKSQSFTAEEAVKQKLVEFMAKDREDLFQKLENHKIKFKGQDLTFNLKNARVETFEMSLGEKLLNYLANPNIAAILMTLGMLLIYIEISNPGISVAGIFGGICLIIAFMSFQSLPVHAGGAALLILGLIFLGLEPFVVSGGALAAGGVVSFVLGSIWIIDPHQADVSISPAVWAPAALTLGGATLLIGWAAARTQFLWKKTQKEIGGMGQLEGLAGYAGLVQLVHEDGVTGKALFRGETWDFVSDSKVKVGEEVEVKEMKSFKAFVRPKAKI